MKLSAINLANSFRSNKQQENKNTTEKSPSAASNSIVKNHPNEMLGRSLVNFTGKMDYKPPFYCFNEKYGKEAFDLTYDETTGEICFDNYNTQFKTSSQFRAHPEKRAKIFTVVDEDGIKTETKINPQGKRVETTDSDGRQIFYSLEDKNGNKDIIETQYERGRKIKRYIRPNRKMVVEVIDLKTNKKVTMGPLVEDRVEGKDGIYRTFNIVTGDLYRTEQYFNRGKDYIVVDYSKETGIKTRESRMEKGIKTITSFDNNGVRAKDVVIDKKGSKTFTTYGKDGHHAVSTVKNDYDSEGYVKTRTIFEAGSDVISTVIEIDRKNGIQTYFNYLIDPNVTISSSKYQGEVLIEECEYYNTGKDNRIISQKTTYDRNEVIEEYFNVSGRRPKTKAIYRKDGKPYKIELYDTKTGKVYEKREMHPNKKGWYTVSQIDSYNEKLLSKDVINNKRELIQRIYYHENGKQAQVVQDFNADRSYTERIFDEKGKIISKKYYWADGVEK